MNRSAAVHREPVDRGDVDNLGWSRRTRAGAEGAEQRLDQKERGLNIKVHHFLSQPPWERPRSQSPRRHPRC